MADKPPTNHDQDAQCVKHRDELVDTLLRECQADYADGWATFAHLDGKAMNVITVAGIFLAAALVGLDAPSAKFAASLKAKAVFISTIVVLASATLSAILTMLLIKVGPPADAESMAREVDKVLQLPDSELTDRRMHEFHRGLCQRWVDPLNTIGKAVKKKACCVRSAQGLLALGVCGATGVLVSAIAAL